MTAMLVQVRNRARSSLAPLSQAAIFGEIDNFAFGLCRAETACISVLASVADRSAEDGGAPNCIYSESGKLRVLLSGISASQMPPSNDGAAEILRTIATGIFSAIDQVALAVEERDGGGAAELSFLLYQLHVGGFSPDSAAADPTFHLRPPVAATEGAQRPKGKGPGSPSGATEARVGRPPFLVARGDRIGIKADCRAQRPFSAGLQRSERSSATLSWPLERAVAARTSRSSKEPFAPTRQGQL